MAEIDLGTVTIEKARSMTGSVNAVPGEAGGGGGITLPTLSNPAAAADIRNGMESIGQSGKKITGSMPEKAAQTFDPSLSEQIINAGQYLKGAQTINPVTGALLAQLDPDFTAENIRKGAELFGVPGSYEAPVSMPVIHPLDITENGTYAAPSGVDGYNPITVSVAASGGGGGASEVVLASDCSNATETYNLFRPMCDDEAECNVFAYKGDASTLGINNKLVYFFMHKRSPSTATASSSAAYVRYRNGNYSHEGNVTSTYDLSVSAGDTYIHWALKPMITT